MFFIGQVIIAVFMVAAAPRIQQTRSP